MKLALGAALLALAAGTARADNAKADEKFRLGKKLLAQKHFAEACQAFEDSNKLEPGIGAELNTGHCYEEWGKLATAYRAYERALNMATAAKDARLQKIKERMDALDPQVPRLTIELSKDATTTGLVVTLDGDAFSLAQIGQEQRIDPGPHKIEYKLGDAPARDKLIPLERGGSSDITLDVPHVDAVATAKGTHGNGKTGDKTAEADPPDVPVRHAEAGHTRRVEGVVAIGVGGAAIVVSGIVTLSARSRYKSALASDCGGDTSMCNAAGLTATHSARHEANVATVVFGLGAAVAAAGVVLYVTSPHGRAHEAEEATRIAPTLGPDGTGLVLLGSF